MSKCKIGVVVVMLLATPAHAATRLPDAMLGNWCVDENHVSARIEHYTRGCADLVIGPDGPAGCRIKRKESNTNYVLRCNGGHSEVGLDDDGNLYMAPTKDYSASPRGR